MELSRENLKKEVGQVRSSFKEEELTKAEKSLFWEKKGNVALIVFDSVGEKANKLSTPNMLRLCEVLMEIETSREIGSAVIISRKPTIFIAGADIAEIQTLNQLGEKAGETLAKLQGVFTFLEGLPIPTIAAIHGAALGGGFELALSCDYRMVTDGPETKIGLPEVQLGIIPGWGGTQRLPRLIGLEKSLDLILSGRQINGKAAKKMGIADKLTPQELLEEKALAWAAELAKTRTKRSYEEKDLKRRLIDTVPGAKFLVFEQAKKTVLEKTKGHYPAPLKALSVIRRTYGGPLAEGLKVEAQAFTELVGTPECKNLIRIFYLTEKVKKDKGAAIEVRPREITKAAVVGAGVMGGGIAQLFAAKKVRIRMKDINWDAITKGYQAAYRIFKKQLDRRKMKQNEVDNVMSLIEGTTSYSGFKHLDLVVEAVVEDLEIKKKVFQELDVRTSSDTILATNTSSLSVATLAQACKDPRRVVGMHFFNPVDKMPLVEIIRGPQTSDEAVAALYQLCKKLGKTPIVVKDSPGFVVNRILGPYLIEAYHLITDGVGVVEMDEIMEKFGMPMGPCTLIDAVGIDIIH
ncbi:MAG: enoyl-CoA hydratase/isomerase family protein, partial [Deltaproteobacteria bacterium]|nr:enoyl-CoA hydratase/isomerase family protein [Deltaproteobacteria bacterium]